jgi:cellulose synthase/poly-beta-1,6-N-acetylglucosamine synthase-like glycosyltransferase
MRLTMEWLPVQIEKPRTAQVVALVPAYNEEADIAMTVESLLAQSYPVSRIIVIANNCTDRTAAVARQAGAEVIEMPNNPAKKAGALNVGLAQVLPGLSDGDYIICQDADGELSPDFVKNGLAVFERRSNLGGLSGAIVARKATNTIETIQAIEYARGTRLMGRKKGRVHVLSGAATIFPVAAFRAVAAARGSFLPGPQGQYYTEDSLTEDYELTLAIRKLGYDTTSTKLCPVVTDLMRNVGELEQQRIRWYRGALESLWIYGFNRHTAFTWGGVIFTLFVSLLFPASVLALVFSYLAWGLTPNLWFFVLIPIFMAEKVVAARRVSGQAVRTAIVFVPLWLYDNAMFILYWRALLNALRRSARVWNT